ncbi:39S ribosomal protein L48, mitochondrial isoform X1 [Ictalurus furcatus]|uniref:39S ribosomal protein L48, mitochondrial isoform X1 n=1 Tax=Ictalurus furcatus TaxID=66913 RepID=UPI0023504E0F|nr:39S ribosomal protein L48, mitochondrial isoform X1 [Ictalurus furcatus]
MTARWKILHTAITVLLMQNTRALVQAVSLIRSPVLKQPVSLGAFMPDRQYRSMPTHGIGRYKYLLPKEMQKKKKEKAQMKEIKAATDTEYGVLNMTVSGYDMTLVEHYAQYIHKLCNRLEIKVTDSYALPTKSTEVMVMPEQGTKMYVDVILKTHERVVQISRMKATLAPVLMEVLLKNQPEGVQLCIKEHTEAEYKARFKARPELEGLLAQMS